MDMYGYKKRRIVNGREQYTGTMNDPYVQLLVYNEMENLNKKPFYFIPMLIQLINQKGHTYELLEGKRHIINKDKITKEDIMKAKPLTDRQARACQKAIKGNDADRETKVAVKRYEFRKKWGLAEKDVDEQVIKRWYGKDNVLDRCRVILGKIELKEDDWDLDVKKTLEQMPIVLDLVGKLGFDVKKLGVDHRIPKDQFEKGIQLVKSKSMLMADPNKTLPLFGLSKASFATIKSFMGFANSVLKEWGLCLKTKQKTIRTKSSSTNNSFTYVNVYYLDLLLDITKFVA